MSIECAVHTQVCALLKSIMSYVIIFFFKEALTDLHIYPTPSPSAGCDTRSILKWNIACLNSEFYFWTVCLTKTKESCLPYYSSISGAKYMDSYFS